MTKCEPHRRDFRGSRLLESQQRKVVYQWSLNEAGMKNYIRYSGFPPTVPVGVVDVEGNLEVLGVLTINTMLGSKGPVGRQRSARSGMPDQHGNGPALSSGDVPSMGRLSRPAPTHCPRPRGRHRLPGSTSMQSRPRWLHTNASCGAKSGQYRTPVNGPRSTLPPLHSCSSQPDPANLMRPRNAHRPSSASVATTTSISSISGGRPLHGRSCNAAIHRRRSEGPEWSPDRCRSGCRRGSRACARRPWRPAARPANGLLLYALFAPAC